MADVYAAMDEATGSEAAVKILPPTDDGASIARFQREAEAAIRLSHPHIVRTYDWGAVDGTSYIAMEYLPGPTLKQLIDERGALPENRALEIAAQLADALDFAHHQLVIHRDVKPQNVLLDAAGDTKLADFGIARVVGSIQLTQTRSVLGTAQYISPEQARGGDLDERTDIYSLGVVLFEMLTGQVPFGGDSPLAVALKHTEESPPRPRDIRPEVSPAAQRVVLKALEKSPARRYQTATEMRDALNGALAGVDDVPTAVTTSARPVTVWRRRRPAAPIWLVPAIVAVALIALVVGLSRAFSGGIAVPDVRGMTEDEAQAALDAVGLDFDVAGDLASADVPRGRIISQQPAPGERVAADEIVQVAVSAGAGATGPAVVGSAPAPAVAAPAVLQPRQQPPKPPKRGRGRD